MEDVEEEVTKFEWGKGTGGSIGEVGKFETSRFTNLNNWSNEGKFDDEGESGLIESFKRIEGIVERDEWIGTDMEEEEGGGPVELSLVELFPSTPVQHSQLSLSAEIGVSILWVPRQLLALDDEEVGTLRNKFELLDRFKPIFLPDGSWVLHPTHEQESPQKQLKVPKVDGINNWAFSLILGIGSCCCDCDCGWERKGKERNWNAGGGFAQHGSSCCCMTICLLCLGRNGGSGYDIVDALDWDNGIGWYCNWCASNKVNEWDKFELEIDDDGPWLDE